MEKPTFELPSFIKATGIQDIRQAYQEKEDAKKLKQKQRERVQPKMGKMDIDYQVMSQKIIREEKREKMLLLKYNHKIHQR